MAGFKVPINETPTDSDLVQALLRHARYLANRQQVRFAHRKHSHGRVLKINGTMPDIWVFIVQFERDSHAIASVWQAPRSRRRREQVVNHICMQLRTAFDELTSIVGQVAQVIGKRSLNSYQFEYGGKTHLAGQLSSLSEALANYHIGLISPSQMSEEIHTVLELLLKTDDPEPQNSFEKLARNAAERGTLEPELLSTVLTLKNLRRNAKHRAQLVTAKDIDPLLPQLVKACHQLTFAHRRPLSESDYRALATAYRQGKPCKEKSTKHK